MPDTPENKDQTPATGNPEQNEGGEPQVPEGAQKPDAVKAALKAERDAAKAAKREADELRTKLQEYEDRDKSETEKLAAQAGREKKAREEAEARAADAEGRLLRLEVALDKGLPRELVDRLRGSTREELEADADTLKGLVGGGEAGGATPPAGSFDGGARQPASQKSLDEAIAEAEAKGDWKTVDRLNAMKLAAIAAGQQ